MIQEVFTLRQAQDLQGNQLRVIHDYEDEFGRTLLPEGSMCLVIGVDAWNENDAGIAVQGGGVFPKVVLMNRTTYQEYFENLSVL